MRLLTTVTVCGLVLMGSTAGADHREREARRDPPLVARAAVRGDVRLLFSAGDVRVIRDYYKPRYRRLPPGLQKKLDRTGHLPPGWQRRLRPFPVVLEHRLVVLPHGYRRGIIDRRAVIYRPRTGIVIDATIIF